ncbi:hypothetical protein B0H15DRAFT_554461 [Mycena belliarum]|uniref:Protein Zds1 C-terminal domain-containing protein n=1 Tax=Mycena belliarum TaxID=1033014 RepID=A0AAD6XGQ4_9AGAR|nr:hypothetical protein B0H15DRAFT_554461 [Mycena belliae]
MQQPSEVDIQREVEALRDLRRRSTAGAAIDPDLINQGPPSPTAASTSTLPSPEPASAPSAASDDPFHLFWVPASLHPEIAPAEFRAFLKEHARQPPSEDDDAQLHRSASSSSTIPSGLGRKKSMLSRPYQPSENDSADDAVVPLRRNRSSMYSTNKNQGPQLTISDLQKLEELAEEASSSDDPANLRNILRRSLSLNLSPLALDAAYLGDESDQPIVIAPPGQFLRRTARTRIRKPGLPGDGGGHRFGERRRGPSGRSATSPGLQRTSSDLSSSDHGDSVESRPRTFSEEGPSDRPDSFSEEALIYDAYARDEDEDVPVLPPVLITSSPPSTTIEFADPEPQPDSPPQQEAPSLLPELALLDTTMLDGLDPVIHQPQPTRLLSPSPSDPYHSGQPLSPSRTPSPSDFDPSPTPSPISPATSPPSSSFLSTSPTPRKEKDKKGLFGKWGGDKEKEKPHKASKKERERLEKEQREKDSGFFGSLFGSKKKQDAQPETPTLHGGREAAQALLGQSQRAPRSPGPPSAGAQGMMGGAGGINNYSRYPIHVERAIYRLSHIKLANPRRPLYEQVLISNLMFWYLGVINKAQAGAQAEQTAQAVVGPAGEAEKEKMERERVEREAAAAAAQERAEKERVERERVEHEQRERAEREREMEQKKREASPRRGPLTKAAPPGGGQQRRAEMPVKGPQYEMQHRVMEKEYAGYNGNSPTRLNAPPGPSGAPGPYPRLPQSPTSPKFNQQSAGPQNQEHFYYSPGEAMQQQQQQRLPPGAMPPVDQSTWLVGGQAPPPRQHTSSSPPPVASAGPPHRRSRSPPPPNMTHQQPMPIYHPDGGQGGARLGGRSLSATAVPSMAPPPTNGKIRKGQSAYVGGAPANGRRRDPSPQVNGAGVRSAEEEDMPLAVWQRQQRR